MRSLHRLLPRTLPLLAVTALAVGVTAVPARADHGDLPADRHIRSHTVQDGDTASGLAVRFRAWTAELIAHNHLESGGGMYVGQRLEIPVVTSVARKAGSAKAGSTKSGSAKSGSTKAGSEKAKKQPTSRRTSSRTMSPSREAVRAEIVRAARFYGVNPRLALAVSWQEAGWQMHHVSSAGAIGAMQVLPSTGTWMEYYAGRSLDLRTLRDNVAAGVLLLGVLHDMAADRTRQIAAYYQGIGAVQEHGLYDETRAYVANVRAIKRRLDRGLPPA